LRRRDRDLDLDLDRDFVLNVPAAGLQVKIPRLFATLRHSRPLFTFTVPRFSYAFAEYDGDARVLYFFDVCLCADFVGRELARRERERERDRDLERGIDVMYMILFFFVCYFFFFFVCFLRQPTRTIQQKKTHG
jgi:hypothetical protein